MKLTQEQVKDFLPHREPFLFVDTVESIELPEGVTKPKSSKELVGTIVKSKFKVTDKLEILKGHFPGNPILPGVVQIEMMAQTASFGIFYLLEDPFNCDLEVALLSCSNAKFRKPVKPGMDLEIHAQMTQARGLTFSYQCKILSGDELISETEILAWAKH